MMRHVLTASLMVALVLAAPVALACPYCAGQEDSGYAGALVIGAMMLFPFLVVAVVIPLLRRTGQRAVPFTPIPEVGGESQ